MFKNMFFKKKKRVVVLGLDGVPFSLLNRFIDEGLMPNLAKLRENGTLSSLTASIPEVSSTSWSTFMTGVNPGKHGIYGFMELQKGGYSWKFPNFHDLRSKTLWDIAGGFDKRSIVVNLPSTYPAKPLNGMLVSGFVALDLQKASYPDQMYQYLKNMGYRLDVDATMAAKSIEQFTVDIIQTFRKRIEAINYLFDNEEWDLFIAVITETDRLHHYLWAALEDPEHPQHKFFLNFYQEIDRFIGDFAKKIDSDIPFIMLSDHGFTGIKDEVNLNVFLRNKGYLKFTKPDAVSFEDMDGSSQAFCLDPSRIYIHTKSKYPRGTVEDYDYEKVRNALKTDLLSLKVKGVQVIDKIFLKEEIYSGSCFADAPDLVLLSVKGYDLKGSITRHELTGKGPLTGGHTRENAMLYINRKIDSENPNIVDVGTTVIQLLGLNSDDLDGNPLV
jgi:predicted AlkP superfamily phosphohydrolase/phosphomutase